MDRRITYNMVGGNVNEDIFVRGDIVDEKIIQSIVGTFDEIDALDDGGLIQNRNAYSSYWIGETKLYQTFYREDKTKPYQYAGLCEWGEHENLHPRTGKKTFIISQYHAETEDGTAFNTKFAKALAHMCYRRGDVPIVPHLFFTSFLSDEGHEREFGIETGHMLMDSCDSAILATIDGRISSGMESDIEYATQHCGLPLERIRFTQSDVLEFVEQELGAYEERNRPEYR